MQQPRVFYHFERWRGRNIAWTNVAHSKSMQAATVVMKGNNAIWVTVVKCVLHTLERCLVRMFIINDKLASKEPMATVFDVALCNVVHLYFSRISLDVIYNL